ncbi:pyrroline-5-carboxylate reductase [Sphaeroforma arctica JP610]|uniref:Pyrroline-5-carboxylate reductase n=1 Tax=Sphaeroforma arctica JP610 TaxID=667725 RepID=A0A0L0FTK9_9EUKA|nr:pyrroline-5-carboxylate reductase [Sphaeroforma arctica JP610]KNC79906.1 pyrroline-5-carboxylate reductase [Sphaeroforma arctica JP610]|eukprot:XP_014153808.1 pyrroline-5-carboxylate reductase [Sphaeroforma arctica JP610]
MDISQLQITFLGGGNMCEAMVRGFINNGGIDPKKITVSTPSKRTENTYKELKVNHVVGDNKSSVKGADIIIYCVKPYMVKPVSEEINSIVSEKGNPLVISVMAGVTIDTLSSVLNGYGRCARVMPNTPSLVGAGACGYALSPKCADTDGELVEKLLSSIGVVKKVAENLIDSVTGVSGSGPAYVYMFIEALGDAGVVNGLDRATSRALAAQTVFGAAKMVLENPDVHIAQLRNNVESPAGTTVSGTSTLEKEGLRACVIKAVTAATDKAKELGKSN